MLTGFRHLNRLHFSQLNFCDRSVTGEPWDVQRHFEAMALNVSSIAFTACTRSDRFISRALQKLQYLKHVVFKSNIPSREEVDAVQGLLEQSEGLETIGFTAARGPDLPFMEDGVLLPNWLVKHGSTLRKFKYNLSLDGTSFRSRRLQTPHPRGSLAARLARSI
jgi:hypothetical protein